MKASLLKQFSIEQLTDRERRVLLGIAVGLPPIIILWLFLSLSSSLDGLEREIEVKEGRLIRMEAIHRQIREEQDNIERAKRGGVFRKTEGPLRTQLEDLAKAAGVGDKIKGFHTQATQENNYYSEEKQNVLLRPMTQEQLVGYLFEIKNSRNPIVVKTLKVQRVRGDDKLLDASFEASAFSEEER